MYQTQEHETHRQKDAAAAQQQQPQAANISSPSQPDQIQSSEHQPGVELILLTQPPVLGEGFNIASVLCPIPFDVNEIKYV